MSNLIGELGVNNNEDVTYWKAITTTWKVPKYGIFSGPNFSRIPVIGVFSPNTEKYGPEKTPYLGTCHAVYCFVTQAVGIQVNENQYNK